MDSKVKLGDEERRALERVIARLQSQGFEATDQTVLLALMKAACRLPEEQLLQLLEEGLKDSPKAKKARAR
jgi:hypothetical protein